MLLSLTIFSAIAAKHDEEEEDHVDPEEPVTYNFSRFHFVFALGAMYLAMLMSDWHTVYHPATDQYVSQC